MPGPKPILHYSKAFKLPSNFSAAIDAYGQVPATFINEVKKWADSYGAGMSAQYRYEIYLEALEYLRSVVQDAKVQEAISIIQIQQQVQAINRKQIQELLSGAARSAVIRFTANDAAIAASMAEHVAPDVVYTRTYNTAIAEFVPQIKGTLKKILEEAAISQDPGAFPPEYIAPMLRAVDRLQIKPTGNKPYFMAIEIPDIVRVLGDEEDLSAAYHHGALLKGNKKTGKFTFEQTRANILGGRVSESNLQQPDARKRYRYWRALMSGQSTFKVTAQQPGPFRSFGKFAPTTSQTVSIDIPITGSWKETIQARLGVWAKMGKAPQWILLEFGQNTYSPKINIKPGSIQVRWLSELTPLWDRIVTGEWNDQIGKFNRSVARVTEAKGYNYQTFLSNKIGNYYFGPTGAQEAAQYRPVTNVIGGGAGVGSSSGIFGDLVQQIEGDVPYWHSQGISAGVGLEGRGGPATSIEAFDLEQRARLRTSYEESAIVESWLNEGLINE